MENLKDLIVDDKITCSQLRMVDIIENRLPIAVENLDFSHVVFENEEIKENKP